MIFDFEIALQAVGIFLLAALAIAAFIGFIAGMVWVQDTLSKRMSEAKASVYAILIAIGVLIIAIGFISPLSERF